MGALDRQAFPEGTILAAVLASRSRADGAGESAYRPSQEERRHIIVLQRKDLGLQGQLSQGRSSPVAPELLPKGLAARLTHKNWPAAYFSPGTELFPAGYAIAVGRRL